MVEVGAEDAGLVGVIVAVVWVLTQAGLPRKLAPLAALVVGVVLYVGLALLEGRAVGDAVVLGILAGVAAVGGHSVVQHTAEYRRVA